MLYQRKYLLWMPFIRISGLQIHSCEGINSLFVLQTQGIHTSSMSFIAHHKDVSQREPKVSESHTCHLWGFSVETGLQTVNSDRCVAHAMAFDKTQPETVLVCEKGAVWRRWDHRAGPQLNPVASFASLRRQGDPYDFCQQGYVVASYEYTGVYLFDIRMAAGEQGKSRELGRWDRPAGRQYQSQFIAWEPWSGIVLSSADGFSGVYFIDPVSLMTAHQVKTNHFTHWFHLPSSPRTPMYLRQATGDDESLLPLSFKDTLAHSYDVASLLLGIRRKRQTNLNMLPRDCMRLIAEETIRTGIANRIYPKGL